MFFIVNRTSHGPDWMAIQESCLGDDRLETDFLPFAIDMHRDDLGGRCGNLSRGILGPHVFGDILVQTLRMGWRLEKRGVPAEQGWLSIL